MTNCLEALAFTLCDAGDSALMACPGYARFFSDFGERASVLMSCVQLKEQPEDGSCVKFKFSADKLESSIQDLLKKKKKISAFVHCNPNNPLGTVYSKSLTLDLMKVCAKHKIHFISDEIYALSVYDEKTTFESILCFEKEWPDPMRTHFVWGASKDFGFPGIRFACLYTQNMDLLKVMGGMTLYVGVPPHNQALIRNMVEDRKWLDNVYFPTNKRRLKETHDKLVDFFQSLGGTCHDAVAAPFIMVDLGRFLKTKDTKGEMELFKELFDENIYFLPGSKCYATDPGWFRVTFAIPPEEITELIARLQKILVKKYEQMTFP